MGEEESPVAVTLSARTPAGSMEGAGSLALLLNPELVPEDLEFILFLIVVPLQSILLFILGPYLVGLRDSAYRVLGSVCVCQQSPSSLHCHLPRTFLLLLFWRAALESLVFPRTEGQGQ